MNSTTRIEKIKLLNNILAGKAGAESLFQNESSILMYDVKQPDLYFDSESGQKYTQSEMEQLSALKDRRTGSPIFIIPNNNRGQDNKHD